MELLEIQSPWKKDEVNMDVNKNYKWLENLRLRVLQTRFLEYCECCN